jgi:hypothetical protein
MTATTITHNLREHAIIDTKTEVTVDKDLWERTLVEYSEEDSPSKEAIDYLVTTGQAILMDYTQNVFQHSEIHEDNTVVTPADKQPEGSTVRSATVSRHSVQANNQYIWIPVGNGQIQIKFEDEGVIVDLFNAEEDSVSSAAAEYSDFGKEPVIHPEDDEADDSADSILPASEPAMSEAEEFLELITGDYAVEIDEYWVRHLSPEHTTLDDFDDDEVFLEFELNEEKYSITAGDIRNVKKSTSFWRCGQYDFVFYDVKVVC